MIWLSVLLFGTGFAVIVKGGNWFVDAAAWLARATGLPKILIGATVVSFATTLPEFFVSALAVGSGSIDLGVGNALGSILANTGLILSLSLMLTRVVIEGRFFLIKSLIMIAALTVFFVFSLDRLFTVWESIPLFLLLAAFVFVNVRYMKTANGPNALDTGAKSRPACAVKRSAHVGKFVLGAVGIVLGARLLVDNGVRIAQALQVDESVIGVTLVAFGTSLPELVTTLSAIAKRESAIGIGNVLGANILNLTMLLGTCTLISGGLVLSPEYLRSLGLIIPRVLLVDTPFAALLFLVLILPPLVTRNRVYRWQGYLMLGLYALFIVFLIVNV